MDKFGKHGSGNWMGLGLLSSLGLILVGVLLAAWSLVIFALIIVPAAIAAAVAARIIRRMVAPSDHRPFQSIIIDGEYEILSSEPVKD
jgi:uncharacterized membrane protein